MIQDTVRKSLHIESPQSGVHTGTINKTQPPQPLVIFLDKYCPSALPHLLPPQVEVVTAARFDRVSSFITPNRVRSFVPSTPPLVMNL